MHDPFKRPVTVERAVLAALREMILTRRLAPGEQIRQEAMAAELGVSKLPVRDALKVLEGEGQVVNRPHRGYVVAELHLDHLLEIYRMRELLEREVIEAAITRLTDDDLEQMRTAMIELEGHMRSDVDDFRILADTNRRFHFSLLKAGDKPRTLHVIRLLWDWTEPYRSLYYTNPEVHDLVCEEHRNILEAAAARDLERLLKMVSEHRHSAIAELRQTIPETPAPEAAQ